MIKQQNDSTLLDKAVALLKQSNIAEAETVLLALLEQSPKNLDALYYISLVKFNTGQTAEAIASLERALKIAPDDLRSLSSLANIHGHSGNAKKGIELYQRCIAQDSKNANFQYSYASFLVLDSRANEAIEYFLAAIKLQPNWPEPYSALAKVHQNSNRYDLAESLLMQAVQNKVFTVPIILQLCELMEHQGQTTKAKELLSTGLAVHKGNLSLLNELVRLDKSYATSNLKQQLSAIPSKQLAPNDRFCQQYMLASCEKNAKNYPAEMALLIEAHKIIKATRTFNLNNDFYFDTLANRKLSPNNTPASRNTTELSDYEPIFIVGVPRSGSTLIENVICSANVEILRGEEVNAVSAAIAHVLQSEPFGETDIDPNKLIAPVAQIYHSVNLLEKGKRFTDKSLENVLYIDLLLALFPKAKIIYCDRSPIDSIVSVMRNVLSSLSWAHEIEEILKYFELCFSSIADAKTMFPKQIYTFDYEAFIANSEDESRALLAFCEIEWNEDCLQFHQDKNKVSRTTSTAQIRQGVNKKGLNAGSEHLPFFEPYMERFPWLRFKAVEN